MKLGNTSNQPATQKPNSDVFLLKIAKKSAVKYSIVIPIMLNFVNLSISFVQDCRCAHFQNKLSHTVEAFEKDQLD